MGGCTNCGQKGGCDVRKGGMFAAIDEALERLYPTRRWGERDESTAFEAGISRHEGEELAAAITKRMGTLALFRPGDGDEWCDYIYVLCLGRTPAIIELRELCEQQLPSGDQAAPTELAETGEVGVPLDERYLRVVLSAVTRFAGVQEVAMTMERQEGGELLITESARSGVFDPILLPRMQALVAVLAERDIRHIDFGEIVEAPADFDGADYARRFGAEPAIANYLFYPQPPTTVSTVVVAATPKAADRFSSSS